MGKYLRAEVVTYLLSRKPNSSNYLIEKKKKKKKKGMGEVSSTKIDDTFSLACSRTSNPILCILHLFLVNETFPLDLTTLQFPLLKTILKQTN